MKKKIDIIEIDDKEKYHKINIKDIKKQINKDELTYKKKDYIYVIFLSCIIIIGFVLIDHYCGFNLLKVEEKYRKEIKSVYNMANNSNNLTFYTNQSFKYLYDNKVTQGKYKIKEKEIILNVKKKTCKLKIQDDLLVTTCDFISNEKNIVLFKKDSKEFNKLKEVFTYYINSLPILENKPALKDSRVNIIKNCHIDDNNLICNVDYTVTPSDINKGYWNENGQVVNNTVKKTNTVTYKIVDKTYEFVNMT